MKGDTQTQENSRGRVQRLWETVRRNFRKAIHAEGHSIVDTIRVNIDEDAYLQEVSQDQLADKKIFKVVESDIEKYELTYQDGKLKQYDGRFADTRGKSSKGAADALAFIMSKDGRLYAEKHGKIDGSDSYFFHGSFLDDSPAEMAGLISINDGKITKISGNSGHYTPDDLDLYRGIMHLKMLMPDVFTPDCIIEDHQERIYNIDEFIREMEAPNERGIPKYQVLRNDRIEELRRYKAKLYKFNRISFILKNSDDAIELSQTQQEVSKFIEKASAADIVALISALPENKHDQFMEQVKAAIAKFVEESKVNDAAFIIRSFPEEKLDSFVDVTNSSITRFAEKNNVNGITLILGAFPEKKYGEFIEPVKIAVAKFAENNNVSAMVSVIETFPKKMRKEFLAVAKDVLAKSTARAYKHDLIRILKAFPTKDHQEILNEQISSSVLGKKSMIADEEPPTTKPLKRQIISYSSNLEPNTTLPSEKRKIIQSVSSNDAPDPTPIKKVKTTNISMS